VEPVVGFGNQDDIPAEAPKAVNTTTAKDESIARAVAFKGAIELAAGGVLDANAETILEVAQEFEGYLLGQTPVKQADQILY